jgi:Domain of unknown function (DUF3854)
MVSVQMIIVAQSEIPAEPRPPGDSAVAVLEARGTSASPSGEADNCTDASSRSDQPDRSREDARRAMMADLARSGITNEELINKRFTPRSADEIERITGHSVPGYILRYYDLKSEELTGYIRVRFLEPVYRGGKVQRYWQPSRSFSRAYLDPSINWMEIASDPSRTITVTEGEKKAIALCQVGIPAIAITGVWSFGAKRRGWTVLPEFLYLASSPRCWEIVFDYDQHRKPQVAAALDNFMRCLLDIGGRPSYVLLPGPENGVDDYLVARGVEKFRDTKVTPREDYALFKPLWGLNTQVAIVDGGTFLASEPARSTKTARPRALMPHGRQ